MLTLKKNTVNYKLYVTHLANNLFINVFNTKTNKLVFTLTPRMIGLRGSKRSKPSAALLVGTEVGERLVKNKIKFVEIQTKGYSRHIKLALKGLKKAGLDIIKITDNTPILFNGCKLPKNKRF